MMIECDSLRASFASRIAGTKQRFWCCLVSAGAKSLKAVVNSTPLIALAITGYLSVLDSLFEQVASACFGLCSLN